MKPPLLSAGAVIFAEFYRLRPLQLPLPEEKIPYAAHQTAMLVVLVFSMVSLFVNWRADYVASMHWFNTNKAARDAILSGPDFLNSGDSRLVTLEGHFADWVITNKSKINTNWRL